MRRWSLLGCPCTAGDQSRQFNRPIIGIAHSIAIVAKRCVSFPSAVALHTHQPLSGEPSRLPRMRAQQRFTISSARSRRCSFRPCQCPLNVARRFSVASLASTASAFSGRYVTPFPSGKWVNATVGAEAFRFGSVASSQARVVSEILVSSKSVPCVLSSPDKLPAAVMENVVQLFGKCRVVGGAIAVLQEIVIAGDWMKRDAETRENFPQRRELRRLAAVREIPRDQAKCGIRRAFPHFCHHIPKERSALLIEVMQIVHRDESKAIRGFRSARKAAQAKRGDRRGSKAQCGAASDAAGGWGGGHALVFRRVTFAICAGQRDIFFRPNFDPRLLLERQRPHDFRG